MLENLGTRSPSPVVEMQPEMEKKKALDLNIALNNLGCAARAAFLNFDQHKIVEESFERIAEFMGYVPPVIKK